MFSKSASLYDRIYGSFKDYSKECQRIHSLLQKEHGSADEMKGCFDGAGLIVDYDGEGLCGRGLYVARKG